MSEQAPFDSTAAVVLEILNEYGAFEMLDGHYHRNRRVATFQDLDNSVLFRVTVEEI